MNRRTQGLLLAFTGAVMLRLSFSDAYLRYVTDWMKWPVAVSGLLLLALAVRPLFDVDSDDDEQEADLDVSSQRGGPDVASQTQHAHHGVPSVTWLLMLPGLVAFMIAPPALGSYLAERRSEPSVVTQPDQPVEVLVEGEAVPVEVQDFLWRAQEGGASLRDRTVELTGFVSHGAGGRWFVTRVSIGCCAADAVPYQVEVTGVPRPARDEWVVVTGTHVPGSGALDPSGNDLTSTAAVEADEVTPTTAPAQTYS